MVIDALKAINVALDGFCCLICAILLISVLSTEYRHKPQNRILAVGIVLTFFTLLTNSVQCLLDRNPSQAAHAALRVAYFCAYVCGPALLIIMCLYFAVFIADKTALSRSDLHIIRTAIASKALDILLVLVSQFNGMYYTIDATGTFHRQAWWWLSQALSFACIVLNITLIFAHAKALNKKELVFFFSYAFLPALAVAIQIAVPGLGIINHLTTLVMLMCYVSIQQDYERSLKQKELELANARIDIMISQIRPHFLYNSLTAIAMLCKKAPLKAEQAIIDFSVYLRGNMDALTKKETISFDKELKHVEVYLSLEKMRFGSDLHIVYDIQATDFFLPAISVQPIVENAVKHGVGKKEGGGTITIATRETAIKNVVIVTDDGVGFDPDARPRTGGIGILSVTQRLKAQCGGILTIHSHPGGGTVAMIEIPKKGEM